MTTLDRSTILARLSAVSGPDGTGDIVSLGLVSDVLIHGGKVMFSITVDAARARELEPLRERAADAIRTLPGVESALVILTAEKKGGGMEGGAPPPRASASVPPPNRPAAPASASGKPGIPGVGAIIAVASGKGGVGKYVVPFEVIEETIQLILNENIVNYEYDTLTKEIKLK